MATSPKCMDGLGEWTEVVKKGAKATTTPHQQYDSKGAKKPTPNPQQKDEQQQQQSVNQRKPQLEQECQQGQEQQPRDKQDEEMEKSHLPCLPHWKEGEIKKMRIKKLKHPKKKDELDEVGWGRA